MRTCYRKGDGDNTVVGEPQQLYKPMDLHDVQWPPTSSSGALLSRDATHALPDDRHVMCVVWARASASDTVQTICTVTDCCFHTETHLNDSTATSLEHYTDDGCCTHTESCWRSKIHSLVLNEKVVRTERRKDKRVGGGCLLSGNDAGVSFSLASGTLNFISSLHNLGSFSCFSFTVVGNTGSVIAKYNTDGALNDCRQSIWIGCRPYEYISNHRLNTNTWVGHILPFISSTRTGDFYR